MFVRDDKLIKEVGVRLQQVRKRAGISREEMALRMGITTGAYIKNERGMNFPGLITLKRLARDFDISMDWLIFNKEPMHYKKKREREIELEQTVKELEQKVEELSQVVNESGRAAEELTHQLDEERKKQEKAAEERAKAIEMRPEVRDLLDYMEQDAVFYHRLMLNFQEFRLKKKEIGDIEMMDNSASIPQLPDQS